MEWVYSKNIWRAKKSILPGVWRHRDGGFVVRGAAMDPRTGKRKDILKVLPTADAITAQRWLQDELIAIRSGEPKGAPKKKVRFSEFSASLFEARVAKGTIKSAATRRQWDDVLRNRLAKAGFWNMYVDVIRRADIEAWTDEVVAPLIAAGTISPHTANTWFSKLRTIVSAFVGKYELERNPMDGMSPFDTRGVRAFTVEQPNSLTPQELGPFLAMLRDRYPQHYAYCLLGFLTGLRPSTMRPIRVPEDVLWDEGAILIRRSHTHGTEVMEMTKTDEDQKIGLPAEVMDVLKWHVERLSYKQRETGLLFPSRWPQSRPFMARSSLTVPFADVAKQLKLTKRITAKGMRRTAKDLQRRAEIDKRMRTAISGHKTEAAEKLYETVGVDETRAAVAKVINLMEYRKAVGA